MLELDLAVALALVLSLASTGLCVGYGLTHWNADDDPDEDPSDWVPSAATAPESKKELDTA